VLRFIPPLSCDPRGELLRDPLCDPLCAWRCEPGCERFCEALCPTEPPLAELPVSPSVDLSDAPFEPLNPAPELDRLSDEPDRPEAPLIPPRSMFDEPELFLSRSVMVVLPSAG
jgi:hypothetical protein